MVATFAAYAPALGYGFVYEDLNDRDTFLTAQNLNYAFTEHSFFRLMPRLVWSLCLKIGGGNPAPYHAASLLAHALNGWLIYALLGGWAGVIAAGILWLHPLQVESAVYISALPDALAATGILLALLAASRWPWATWLGLAFAVLSKESAIVAYALIPLWVVMMRQRWPKALWASWGVLGAICGAFVLLKLGRDQTFALSGAYTLTQIAILGQYVGRLLLPIGLTIDHDYAGASALLGVGVLTVSAVLLRWTYSRLVVAWFGLSFLPRLIFRYGDGMHEHHWSVAIVGLAIGCGYYFKAIR